MKARSGFTLLELLVSAVVLGILATLLIARFQHAKEKAYVATLQNDMRNFALAQEIHRTSAGSYAASVAGLTDYSLSSEVDEISSSGSGSSWYLLAGHQKTPVQCEMSGGPGVDDVASTRIRCSERPKAGDVWNFGNADSPLADFTVLAGSSTPIEVLPSSGPEGLDISRIHGYRRMIGASNIQYDPNRMYRISVKLRQFEDTDPECEANFAYVGFVGYAADGVTYSNISGVSSLSNHYHVTVARHPMRSEDGWQSFSGYVSGRGRPYYDVTYPNPANPAPLPNAVSFVRPLVIVNWDRTGRCAPTTPSVTDIAGLTVEIID